MAQNPFFSINGITGDNTNEQTLVNDLVKESIGIHGFPVQYLPRTLTKEDTLYGEDVLSAFNSSWTIQMYLENVDNFSGEGDLMSNFGFTVKDEMTLMMSRPEWFEITATLLPLEGDLVRFPHNGTLFEIRFVEDEQQFYPLGTLPSIKIRCELFNFSQEDFNTGITDLDNAMDVFDATEGGMDPFANNDDIETEADLIQDFTESNPFGER